MDSRGVLNLGPFSKPPSCSALRSSSLSGYKFLPEVVSSAISETFPVGAVDLWLSPC